MAVGGHVERVATAAVTGAVERRRYPPRSHRRPVPSRIPARIIRRHPARIRVDDDVELRILTAAHAPALFALTDRNREHLRRWLPWVDGTRSAKDTAKFIRGGREQLRKNDGFQAGIWYRGELVGALGFHYWNWSLRKTEIGYWLPGPDQGEGH